MSLEEIKKERAGWPKTEGLKIGDLVRLPTHEDLAGGEIIGVEEILDQRGPIVYATVRIDNRRNVLPKIEVGELKTIQDDLKLMDHIGDELKKFGGGKDGVAISVKRIEDLLAKLNTDKDVADDSYVTRYKVVIYLQDEEYGDLAIDKNRSGAYRVRLEKKDK